MQIAHLLDITQPQAGPLDIVNVPAGDPKKGHEYLPEIFTVNTGSLIFQFNKYPLWIGRQGNANIRRLAGVF